MNQTIITKRRLTTLDLASYLAALWWLAGIRKVPVGNETDQRFERFFGKTEECGREFRNHFDPRFFIICHRFHGDSETVEEIFSGMVFLLRLARYTSPSDGFLHLEETTNEGACERLEDLSPEGFDILAKIAVKVAGSEHQPPRRRQQQATR